jgi:hypothetical protein
MRDAFSACLVCVAGVFPDSGGNLAGAHSPGVDIRWQFSARHTASAGKPRLCYHKQPGLLPASGKAHEGGSVT